MSSQRANADLQLENNTLKQDLYNVQRLLEQSRADCNAEQEMIGDAIRITQDDSLKFRP